MNNGYRKAKGNLQRYEDEKWLISVSFITPKYRKKPQLKNKSTH
jgi:hypothetical protein